MRVCVSPAVRLLALILVVPLAGCTLYDKYSPSQRAARKQVQQLQSLQLAVMSFADEYVARTGEAITRFQGQTENPEDRLLTQDWRVQQATSAYTIASGPSPVTNALDMVVLASLSRMRLEDHWVVERFGPRLKPLQETYRRVEAEAWQIVDGVLTEEQSRRLKEIMAQWRASHPEVQGVAYVHFQEFADSLGRRREPAIRLRAEVYFPCWELILSPPWIPPCAKSPRAAPWPSARSITCSARPRCSTCRSCASPINLP